MIKMKKSAALILAGVLACSMPMPVMASSDTEVVESLLDSGIDFLASDPGKAVDIIMYAKDLVDQQNITDDQVRSAVTQAADHFGVSLSDSDVDSLVSVVRKVLDAKIDEDALRSDVNSVYSKLQDMGVTKDDAKGLVSKLIEFVKGLFEFVRDFEGAIPGAEARDCGNYLDQNLPMAKYLANRYLENTVKEIDEAHLVYAE